MNLSSFQNAIKSAVNNRIKNEARAKRGKIRNGMFQCGNKSYPFKLAVDCNISNGRRAWAQLSTNGQAVIVGA